MTARDMNEPIVGSKRALSPRSAPAKRAKAAQACLSCRKHKTRCEMLDGDNSGAQCHRCKVLNLACSFEDGTGQSSASSSARAQQSDSVQPSIDRRSSVQLPKKSQDVPMGETGRHPKGWGDTLPDTLPPFRASSPDVEEVDILNPAHLLPEKHSPWGFLKLTGGFESSMVPILSIQALTRKRASTAEPSRSKVDQTLLHILGREQVKYLVNIFEERYNPWLNLQPSSRDDGPLIRLAQCCIASRHLEPSIRSIVAPQLYRLADDVILRQTFNPLPSTDAIHAILILSVWEPVGEITPKECRDGRLIAATAVSMAMNLRLSEAMVYVETLRNQKKQIDPPNAELIEALDKARLWFALNSIETMLCVGTGREPISDCRSLMHEALDTTSYTTISAIRDSRLSLFCQLSTITKEGLSIRLRSSEDLGLFYKEVLDFLSHMDVLERLISPLAEHEAFYFHMLHVYYQACRLIVLVHALVQAKNLLVKTVGESTWFLAAEHNGVNLAQSWGHHALVLSEAILITMISRSELALMSTIPDNLFIMITFSATFVLLSKWSVYENIGRQMPGSSDSILEKMIERLSAVACSPDHVALKCARLIQTGILSFKKKSENSELGPQVISKPMERHFTEYDPTTSRSANASNGTPTGGFTVGSSSAGVDTGSGLGPGQIDPQYGFPHLQMSDPNYFMNSEFFFDNDFWSSFMNGMSMTGR